jgi:uncharacterized protein
MIYREYGRTGKKISAIGFGGMRFADVDNREACAAMMAEAAGAGINYFDTAPAYFGKRGEEAFGAGFAELKRRKLPFFSATKTFKSAEADIRRQLDGQLKRLGLEAVDFYHVWCITTLEDWKERKRDGVLAAFRKLKDEHLIRHICVSSHLIGDEIRELLMEGVFEGVLFGYSAYNFNAREKAFEAVAARRLGAVVMNPLGGGLIPQNPRIFDFIRTRKDETVVQAALRFVLSHEAITCALVGFATSAEIRGAVSVVDGFSALPGAEIARIKASLGPAFEDLCTGCRYCDSCPEDIPIPKMMDAYNHRKLEGTEKALRERLDMHWGLAPSAAAACTECGQCEKLCTQHLPIIRRLAEIAALEKKG